MAGGLTELAPVDRRLPRYSHLRIAIHPTRSPKPDKIRKALYGWAFNVKQRELTPSASLAKTIGWIERNTIPLADLAESDTLRRVVNQLASKQDGTPAAATVVARKRAVLFNLLNYAVGKKHFPMNPLASVSWKSPKAAEAIDRRRVVNPYQARALLDAVATQGPMGQQLEAFFGRMYHAALRPAETVMLTRDELELPKDESKWGWFHLGSSAPSAGGAWNETGDRRERRHLKHRAASEVREVPISPALGKLLHKRINEHGTAPEDACSAAKAAVCSPTLFTAASGKEPARPPSHLPRKHHPS